MNKERLQQLHDAIEAAPPEEFFYNAFFSGKNDGLLTAGYLTIPKPHCGTAGCVAGWALMLFIPGERSYNGSCGDPKVSAFDQAKDVLDLSSSEATFLFLEYAHAAKREDALRRLRHLLDGDHPDNYHWETESWRQLQP